MMKFFSTLFYILFIGFLLGVAGLLVGSMLPIPGNIEIKIVKSGSMEPAIPTGSLVVVKPADTYGKGDVITFGKDTQTDIPTTHRVIAINADGSYTVKGDANEEQDPNPVLPRDVIGKVVIHIPGAGFVLDFARQPLGFALLIGIPAGLVILEEIVAIFKELKKSRRRRDDDDFGPGGREHTVHLRLVNGRRHAMDEIFLPMYVAPSILHKEWWQKNLRLHTDAYGSATMLVLGLVFVSSMMAGGAGGTISYFSDIERSLDNLFSAGSGEDFLSNITPLTIETEEAAGPEASFATLTLSDATSTEEVLGTSTTTESGEEPEAELAQTAPEPQGGAESSESPESLAETPEPPAEPEPEIPTSSSTSDESGI